MIYSTILYGKNLCNLLANKVVEEYTNIDRNHLTEIYVLNTENFLILKGRTTIKKILNFSPLFYEYIYDRYGVEINFNVIDLIEYDSIINSDNLFLDLKVNSLHTHEVVDYSQLSYQGYVKVDDSLNVIYFNNINLVEKLGIRELNLGYSSNLLLDSGIYSSDKFFGLSLNMNEKIYSIYIKYIFNHLVEKSLCKEMNFKIYYEGDINEMNWENMLFSIDSPKTMVSINWIESMILDLFDFNHKKIISKFNLDTYDFSNEINGEVCWKKIDLISEIILI
jgi:hypothetical protein